MTSTVPYTYTVHVPYRPCLRGRELTRVALRLQRRLGAGRRVAAVLVTVLVLLALALALGVAMLVGGRCVARAAAGLVMVAVLLLQQQGQ